MRPDIAILSPLARNLGPAHGGITPVIIALSSGLCAAGARVELLTLSEGDRQQQLPKWHPDLTVYPLGRGRRWQQSRRLRRYLAERAPTALLAAGHRANLLAAHQAGGSVRVLLSVHNAIAPGLQRLNLLRRWSRGRALRRWYPRADGIICVSHGVANDVSDFIPAARSRIHVHYNPISGSESELEAPLHPWLTDAAQTVILAAGRLTTQKGFDHLIRAFAPLAQQPSLRLVILGEGPERAALTRLAQQLGVAGSVALPGFVPNPRAHMRAAAVFVLSSRWEGFGNVLVEAMAAGTPVLSTDCPSGPREILADGRFGPLVAVGDTAAMTAAIQRLLTAPTPAAELRERAAAFSPERIAAEYLQRLIPTGLPSHAEP